VLFWPAVAKVNAILVAALVASLGANAWLVASRPAAGEGASADPAEGGEGDAEATPEAPRGARTCERQLEACEASAKLRPLLFGSGRQYAGSDRMGDSDQDADRQEFLCSIARRQAEDRWREKEPEIVLGLRMSLADPATQERDVQAAVQKYGDTLGLSDAERTDFERRYRKVRLARVDELRDAMQQDPPDYERVMAETRALFRAEDELAAELGGEQASRVLADSEREARAALLSVAATLAGAPWEDALEF
jgi:hypothetical protein